MRFLALLLAAGTLIGCAAKGSPFQAGDAPPPDKGTIYFYRPAGFVGGGVAVMLVDNGTQIQRLQNGQFIRYDVSPGHHKLHTDTMAIDKAVEFDVEAGQTYYVRAGLRQGFATSTWWLSRVFAEEALAELKECCKSGK